MNHAVFTYGTLMVASVMRAVAGQGFAAEPARVRGFERFCVVDAVYPGLLETGRGSTPGVVYRGVDDDSLAVLDRFEGDLYERRLLEIEGARGQVEPAQCWVVPLHCASLLDGTPWDLQRFERDHLAAYLDVCHEFRRADARNPGPQS